MDDLEFEGVRGSTSGDAVKKQSKRLREAKQPVPDHVRKRSKRDPRRPAGGLKDGAHTSAGREETQRRIEERSRFYSFMHALSAASPIISSLAKKTGFLAGPVEIQASFQKLYEAQIRITKKISDKFELDPRRPTHKKFIMNLAVDVGDIISNCIQYMDSISDIEKTIEATVDEIIRIKTGWSVLPYAQSGEESAKDVSVNTQLSLLRSSSVINDSVSKFFFIKNSYDVTAKALELAITHSGSLTKGWNGELSAVDKEVFFNNILRYVASIAGESLESHIFEQMGNNEAPTSVELIESKLEPFRELVAEMHMGHDKNIRYVHEKAAGRVHEMLLDGLSYFGDINRKQKNIVKNYLLDKLVVAIAQAWQDAVNDIFEKVSAMTPEEQSKWERTEGSKPMDLNYFDELYVKRVGKILEFNDIIIESDKYQDTLQKGVALFWGAAQAVYRSNQSEDR